MDKDNRYDVIIVGGGLIGLSFAAAMASADLEVAVIEYQSPDQLRDQRFDGRVSAISYGSRRIFETLDLWAPMAENAGAIRDIRIVDGNITRGDSPLWLHYDHREVGDEPMGHIIENRTLRKVLLEAAENHPHITLLAPISVKSFTQNSDCVTVVLSNDTTLYAPLLVAADGRRSRVRDAAGISVKTYDYKQTAIVCTVHHEQPHGDVAIERFLPAGPFAILPMGKVGDHPYGHHSSLVWSEKAAPAPHFLTMDAERFNHHLAERFGDYLGKVTLQGERWSYPLSLSMASDYTAPRVALVGDAAHGIHPIAGQGFNLGLRDVAVLAEELVNQSRLGLDIGSDAVLKPYEQLRRGDVFQMIAATDGLNRLFSNAIPPIRWARRAGLAIVEKTPPLKRAFMRHAMGVKGHSPKLISGKPL